MVKRVAIASLWFYAGWCAGAAVVFMFGLSPFMGPVIGALFAVVTVIDPRGMIWKKPQPETPERSPRGSTSVPARQR